MTERSGNKKRGSLVAAWLLWLGCPVYLLAVLTLPNAYEYSQSVGVAVLLWCFACLYLIFRGIRRMVKGETSPAASAGAIDTRKADEPVSWLVGTASFASSRASAVRDLPEYAAKLLSGDRR